MPLFAKGPIPIDIKRRVLSRWLAMGGGVIPSQAALFHRFDALNVFKVLRTK